MKRLLCFSGACFRSPHSAKASHHRPDQGEDRSVTVDMDGSLFSLENQQKLEQSFKEFVSRPEHKPLLEQHQKDEVTAAVQLQEQAQQAALEQEVSQLHPADIKLLAPVMRSPTLRQLMISFLNNTAAEVTAGGSSSGVGGDTTAGSSSSGGGGLSSWINNPRVRDLLKSAAKALRDGRMTEQQLAAVLQEQVQVMQQSWSSSSASSAQPAVGPHQAMLPSHMLVEALNEHLNERYAGSRAYQRGDYTTAMHHYERALAIVNFVVGGSADDQGEVMHNKALVLLNMAAVHMAQQDWGAAVQCCDEALKVSSCPDTAVKAWLRRSKANLGRHEYEAALGDLDQVQELEPFNGDVVTVRAAVMTAKRRSAQEKDRALAARMFKARS